MKISFIGTSLAFASVVASTADAQALNEQQIASVQAALKGAECTVEDTKIKAKGEYYKVDDAQCKDGPVRHPS